MKEIKYKLVKKDSNGDVYYTSCLSDEDLLGHINGTFRNTDHEIIAIINVAKTN